MKCLNCNKEIKQIGNRPKKFCSDSCRKSYHRNSATIENSKSATIENNKNATIENKWKGYGWCKYCGTEMEFKEGECCHECATNKNKNK